jgi:hypothetical protein
MANFTAGALSRIVGPLYHCCVLVATTFCAPRSIDLPLEAGMVLSVDCPHVIMV